MTFLSAILKKNLSVCSTAQNTNGTVLKKNLQHQEDLKTIWVISSVHILLKPAHFYLSATTDLDNTNCI